MMATGIPAASNSHLTSHPQFLTFTYPLHLLVHRRVQVQPAGSDQDQ
jgi:hypothetical protein